MCDIWPYDTSKPAMRRRILKVHKNRSQSDIFIFIYHEYKIKEQFITTGFVIFKKK